jgi:drug/metabolite transporter (DMT)-like permease
LPFQLVVTSALAFAFSLTIEGPGFPAADVCPALVGLGVGVSAVAYLLQVWAQTRLGPARTAVILTMEPVFGVFFGILLLGERLDLKAWIGAAVILIAIQVVLAYESDEPVLEAEGITAAH